MATSNSRVPFVSFLLSLLLGLGLAFFVACSACMRYVVLRGGRAGVPQHGSITSDRRRSGRRYCVGATSTSPCHVSIDMLSHVSKSCLVRACEDGPLVVRAPGSGVDLDEKRRTPPPSPIPVVDRDNRNPFRAGGPRSPQQAGRTVLGPRVSQMQPACLMQIYSCAWSEVRDFTHG